MKRLGRNIGKHRSLKDTAAVQVLGDGEYKILDDKESVELKGGENFITVPRNQLHKYRDKTRGEKDRERLLKSRVVGDALPKEPSFADVGEDELLSAGMGGLDQWRHQRALHGLPASEREPIDLDTKLGDLKPGRDGKVHLTIADKEGKEVGKVRFKPPHPSAADMPQQKRDALMGAALTEIMEWGHHCEKVGFILQKNECSRLHKLIESVEHTISIQVVKDDNPNGNVGAYAPWDVLQTFVVKHDWAAAFGQSLGAITEGEFILPYSACAFEFKVTGRAVTLVVLDAEEGIPRKVKLFIEACNDVWASYEAGSSQTDLADYLVERVKAICVMLDSAVAETELIRQPTALNLKRAKAKKTPLKDYHIVDLSRKHRASANPNPQHTGRKVRAHWRRGHWRHFTDHKTWIKWQIVGDPDLGFVEKEYKL